MNIQLYQILIMIEERLAEGEPPSQREIAEAFGMVQNSVYQLIGYLRQKGYLADSKGHRGLRLSKAYAAMRQESHGLPIVGRVAAGQPILAQENVEAYLVEATANSAAGEDTNITHTLGRDPIGYLILSQHASGGFYEGSGTNDNTNLFIKCSTASVRFKVAVI